MHLFLRSLLFAAVSPISPGLWLTLLAPFALGQEQPLRSTWDCLPEQTVVAARIPNGIAIVEALREYTKLGEVLFSDKRVETASSWLFEKEDGDGDTIRGKLGQYGLTPDDLTALCTQEIGMAMLIDHPADSSPISCAIVWANPGDDIAVRIYEAIGKAVDEHADDEHPQERFDLDIDDNTVMQVIVPEVTTEHEEEFQLPDDYDELSTADAEQAWDRANSAWESSAVEVVRYRTMLVATIGGRLLCAYTLSGAEEEQRETSTGHVTDIFARLLAAHRDNEGQFAVKLHENPVFNEIDDLEGVIVFELRGDAQPIIELARKQAEQADEGLGAEKVFDMAGVECLREFGMRMTLDRSQLRSRAAWALEQPLAGLLQLLDQSNLDPDPPAWVPANVVGYSQYSFDLGKAYVIIKEELQKHVPEETTSYLQMLEGQVTNMAGANVEEVFGSLGRRHTLLSFEPQFRVIETGEDQEEDDEGVVGEQPVERAAIVWQVANDEMWPRLMNQIAAFSAMAPGLEHTEEQGFSGWRYTSESLEGGLVLGNGYLVLAYGPGVLEMTLSAINRPPQGDAALRNGEIYRRATELMELKPAIMYELVDGNRNTKIAYRTVTKMIEQIENLMESVDDDEQVTSWTTMVRELMPTDEEVEGLIGVTAGQWGVDAKGVWANSVCDLPPSDGGF